MRLIDAGLGRGYNLAVAALRPVSFSYVSLTVNIGLSVVNACSSREAMDDNVRDARVGIAKVEQALNALRRHWKSEVKNAQNFNPPSDQERL